ncbi:CU044_2847 family protein [Streptomyces longwoodensis]|uniref:CU044_2847 family protein n=1 Tax=Streptomyces longwoodensis TaxID=68231 RepID=UPI00224EB52A|nr:CU044_2847 family protein [Streptomyces longwoodensis]MCX4995876.1 CU044_2847 family protein [Streptomyces longwoodensis]
MSQDVTRVARIALPDGTPVWARISGTDELAAPPGQLSFSDTGFTERVEASVESLHALVTGVAHSLAGPLRAVRPDEVSVEFGIELTAKAGKVVGLLADGEAKAGITVTLTWNGSPPHPDSAPPGAPDATPSGAPDTPPSGAPHPTPPGVPHPTPPGDPGRTGASPGAPAHGGADGPSGGGGA